MNTSLTKTLVKATTVIHRRPVAEILERQKAREMSQVHTFPPDFVHGDARLDELYDVFGNWAEDVIFVRSEYDDAGNRVACSVARFDDWFLTIAHARSEDTDLGSWLVEQKGTKTSMVTLDDCEGDEVEQAHRIPIHCTRAQLLGLEYKHLHVTREVSIDMWDTAQTDLLSLVCLCARLGQVA